MTARGHYPSSPVLLSGRLRFIKSHPPGDTMTEQLPLFKREDFSIRLPVPEALTLFWDLYFQHLPSAITCKSHRKRLASYFRDFYLDSISKSDVEGYRRWMKAQGYSEPTINKGHMVLTRMYNKLREFKEAGQVGGHDFAPIVLPEKNPGSLVKKVNERAYARKVAPGREKVFRLVAFAKQFGYHDMADIIEGLYLSRLRQSDFYRLTASNVDMDHGLLQGIQHKTITTVHPSGVPFLVVMADSLKWMVGRKMISLKPGSPLFRRRTSNQLKFDRIRKAAGLPYVTLQDLRRAAATHLLDSGVDPQTVAEGLGHTTLRMLPSYTPRTLKHHREASELLSTVEEK